MHRTMFNRVTLTHTALNWLNWNPARWERAVRSCEKLLIRVTVVALN